MDLDASLGIIRREDFAPSLGRGDDGDKVGFASSKSSDASFPDYANAAPPPEGTESKFRGGITTHFPALLHAMLTKAESDGYSDICCWKQHGRAFTVYNRDRFVREVMPLYFRQSQFASFQRQLNLYGFHRLSQKTADSVGAYYHAQFLRTRQDLCPAIQRATEKEIRERNKQKHKGSLPDPDFARMPPMPQATKAHIEMASNIAIPQRKCSNSQQQQQTGSSNKSLPESAAAAGPRLQVAALPEKELDLFSNLPTESEDKAVDSVYASLFAPDEAEAAPKIKSNNEGENFDDFDLSWMEPRPIAPGAIQKSSNHSQQPTVVSSNFDDVSSLAWMGPLAANSGASSTAKKRARPSPKSSEDPTMASFLHDIDLDLSDNEDPLAPLRKLPKTSGDTPPAIARGGPAAIDASSAEFELLKVHPPLSLSALLPPPPVPNRKRRRKQVKLPTNFDEVTRFPLDEPLMITRSCAPFNLIYVNPCLEELWEMKRSELLDLPLQTFCATSRDYARANHAAFSVLHSAGACQDPELAFELGSARGRIRRAYKTKTGPFYMADDPSQINHAQYLVWHFTTEIL